MRRSYARPDRYRHPNCDDCRIMPAVVGNLCVRCDHARWLASQEAQQQAAAIASLNDLRAAGVAIFTEDTEEPR